MADKASLCHPFALTPPGFWKGKWAQGNEQLCRSEMPTAVGSEDPQGGRAGRVPGEEEWGLCNGLSGCGMDLCGPASADLLEALHARVQEQALGSDKGLRRGTVLLPVGSLLLPCHIFEVSK